MGDWIASASGSRRPRPTAHLLHGFVGAGKTTLAHRLVMCPVELARRRVLKRSEEGPDDALWIDDAAIERFASRYEPLASDEACVVVDGTQLCPTPSD